MQDNIEKKNLYVDTGTVAVPLAARKDEVKAKALELFYPPYSGKLLVMRSNLPNETCGIILT